MSDSNHTNSRTRSRLPLNHTNLRRRSWLPFFLSATLLPVIAAIAVYQLDSFDAAPMPLHELSQPFEPPLMRNDRLLQGAGYLGAGKLPGPEDFAYDSRSHVIYTGCADGWIKRVWLTTRLLIRLLRIGSGPVVDRLESLSDPMMNSSLLTLIRDGAMEVLADEAEDKELKLTDGVDVAKDGTVYFTDASYKHSLHQIFEDIMEGRPYGRLLSFDPISKRTKVLLTDLYFPNGVAVSPDQDCVVFCETAMRRCRKYYIQGNKRGHVEKFIENLPGMPDNIKYDGEGLYWIALPTGNTVFWDLAFRYPMVRKATAVIDRLIGRGKLEKNGGVLGVDVNGKPVAHYKDVELAMVTSGIKVKNNLYLGSFLSPYIIRLNLDEHPAQRKP